MSTKIDPVSTIIASFPITELSKFGDNSNRPTYHTLLAVQNDLNTNAASIDTPQGTGMHGLLVLTMPIIEFHEMVGMNDAVPPVQIQHPVPINPGALPEAPTAAEARTHADAQFHHQTYHSTDKALKKMLLAAGPELYLLAIKHPRTGFSNLTTLQMMTHLWTTYGTIEETDLNNNLIQMATAWHPTNPIESLFKQIDDGIEFARAGDSPIDDATAVRMIYKCVFDTGVFELPCRDWRAKPRNEKTLANFKIFFHLANNDRATTTSSAGYHSANAATTTDLVTIINNQTKLLKAFESALAKQTQPKATKAATTTTATANTTRDLPKFEGYCHSHGQTFSYNDATKHTSATCRKPHADHNKAATKENKLGGSERIWNVYTNK